MFCPIPWARGSSPWAPGGYGWCLGWTVLLGSSHLRFMNHPLEDPWSFFLLSLSLSFFLYFFFCSPVFWHCPLTASACTPVVPNLVPEPIPTGGSRRRLKLYGEMWRIKGLQLEFDVDFSYIFFRAVSRAGHSCDTNVTRTCPVCGVGVGSTEFSVSCDMDVWDHL